MKSLLSIIFLSLLASTANAENNAPASAAAQVHPVATGSHSGMKEDQDGNLDKGEYEIISTNGSITRALCPYTCEMRGLPQKTCKSWQSKQDKTMCYVQDTTIATQAIQ